MDRHTGFTLADLLIGIGVLATLLATAVPAFTGVVLNARMTGQVNGLVHAVHLAKQAAHMRLAEVALCRSADGRRCQHDGDWRDGWLLFVNTNGDNPPQITVDEPVLASAGAWRGGTIAANRRFFVFRPATIRSTNGTFTFCDRRGADAGRALIVSYTGRPRTARRAPGNGPLECGL